LGFPGIFLEGVGGGLGEVFGVVGGLRRPQENPEGRPKGPKNFLILIIEAPEATKTILKKALR